jgi:uncharacterized OB-fold protein
MAAIPGAFSGDPELGLPALPWTGPVPVPELDTEPYWAGLREHRLLILRCDECGCWIHPPVAGCPRCLSASVSAHEASGRGSVYSYTLVGREFAPGVPPPYAAAYVDLVEQPALRVVTALVNVRASAVRIGMGVRVVFHDVGPATLAYFEPDEVS